MSPITQKQNLHTRAGHKRKQPGNLSQTLLTRGFGDTRVTLSNQNHLSLSQNPVDVTSQVLRSVRMKDKADLPFPFPADK